MIENSSFERIRSKKSNMKLKFFNVNNSLKKKKIYNLQNIDIIKTCTTIKHIGMLNKSKTEENFIFPINKLDYEIEEVEKFDYLLIIFVYIVDSI